MRLTLRALLAYLDDVLEPATLKEIGVRVSESAPASATVARIKEVVRRRRIAAPELAGSGSAPDPNIVAEYLDNTLDPHGVPALEKLCLESDMHLAEVASAHQILTAVLGEPIEVPVSTRERMYALVSHAPPIGDPLTRPDGSAPVTPLRGIPTQVATTKLPDRPLVPDYLKPPAWRNLAFGILGACILLGWFGWVLKDHGVWPKPGGQPVAAVEPTAGGPAVESGVAESGLVPDSKTPAKSNPVASSEKVAAPPASTPVHTEGHNGEEPALASNSTTPASQPVEPLPDPAVPAVAAPAQVGLAPPKVPEPPQPAVPARNPFPSMMYANSEGILISRDKPSGQWNVMPRRALVHAGDELATPDPFQSEFKVNETALEVTLFGGARVRLEAGVGTDLLSISIDRGHVAFRRPLSAEKHEPVSIELGIRGQSAALTLSEPGSQCGVEVGQRAPQGNRPDPLLTQPEGGIHVVAGSVSLAWNGKPPVVIGSDVGWAAWPIAPKAVQVGPLRAIPNWLAPEGVQLTAADKNIHKQFEKEFTVDQPVNMSIPALITDRRESISTLATYTLGLVDDVPMLVKALQSEHEKTRQAAIWNLRSWLPTNPDNTATLEMEVERFFIHEDVSDVVDLLWGYPDSAAQDQTASRKLVQLMDHKELAIRELAFFQVSRLVSRTNAGGYRPDLSESHRNAALMPWRNLLEKNGGKLK